MTIAKASLLAIGFIGAVALGVAIGPSLTQHDTAVIAPPAAEIAQPAATPASKPLIRAPRTPGTTRSVARAAAIPASTPELHTRLKPVLNRGANMTVAAEGFRDAEQFATVAHAARNTQVPFMLLKHRVLNEGQTLSAAIRSLKPDADAASEANRARTEARSDIAVISS